MAKSPRDPVILSACRTPVGKISGALASVRPDDLLAKVFSEAATRAKVPKEQIEEAYAGCANQAGEDNRNVARMAVLLAGFSYSVPAVTVNRLCASGLEAVVQASRAIKLGDISVALAGGVESMSRAPWVMGKPNKAFPTGAPEVFDSCLGWRFPNPKMRELFPLEAMGETAENLAEQHSISRVDQDEFALNSHQKACKAQEDGLFENEIVPVEIPSRKNDATIVMKDEGPRPGTSLQKLSTLRAAFRKGGTVTAGNSSTLNDGAAALVMASREWAEANGLPILASVRAMASAGVDPRVMGIGPVPATQKLLQKTGLKIEDFDAIELNEAFAVQSLAVIRELNMDIELVNQFGGAIALGHPLGCSGARILTTLLSVLKHKRGTLGLATLCVGAGQGLSVAIERE